MSGIYIHIPYCRQACHYCDFHFSTQMDSRESMVKALQQEIALRKPEIEEHYKSVDTIYFGGGTPSVLNNYELAAILETINAAFDTSRCTEITLETNPEDITKNQLDAWFALGVNRLSIGIQSFQEAALRFSNRNHGSSSGITALTLIKESDFKNYTADLIFGIPPFDLKKWESDLQQMLTFQPPHLSVYGLTIEPKTVFGNWHKKGKLKETDESLMELSFRMADEILTSQSYLHYEVSNYARKGFESQHNSAYWSGEKYIGLGPGAHSFDGTDRWFNVSNNAKYLKTIKESKLPIIQDPLTKTDRINEVIFTTLRTSQGLNLSYLKESFDKDLLEDFGDILMDLKKSGLIIMKEDRIKLSLNGMLLADEISLKMFYG